MNRRGFLGFLGAAAAGMVLDPELLLWKPGAKTIFLPPVVAAPHIFNQFITTDWLSMEMLKLITNIEPSLFSGARLPQRMSYGA